MSNKKFDEWAFDQTVKKGGTIFGCKDKDGVNVGFVNTGTGEYFSLIDEWISVKDRLPLSIDDIKSSKYDCVTVICKDGDRVFIEEFQAGCTIDFWCCFSEHSDVTHWQPLPQF